MGFGLDPLPHSATAYGLTLLAIDAAGALWTTAPTAGRLARLSRQLRRLGTCLSPPSARREQPLIAHHGRFVGVR